MAESLNIQKIFPLARPSIQVKGMGQKKQSMGDRTFDRHLKKENKKKEAKWRLNDTQEASINNQIERTGDGNVINEDGWIKQKANQIDVLA